MYRSSNRALKPEFIDMLGETGVTGIAGVVLGRQEHVRSLVKSVEFDKDEIPARLLAQHLGGGHVRTGRLG